jgi:hypothetical protein
VDIRTAHDRQEVDLIRSQPFESQVEAMVGVRVWKIDGIYEYKYSTLVLFFADLVKEGALDLEDLRGLSEDKLRYIRQHAEKSAA